MNDELILGIDIGTQGVKGVLAKQSGQIITQHQVEHSSYHPEPNWCEQDMTTNWWENPVIVIQSLLQSSDIHAEQIKAISASGLYPALGPTDGSGNPIAKAILYSDNRSVAEVQEVNQALSLQLTSEELTPKLIWFLRNEPQLASQMRMFFDAAHYLVYKLTGEYVTDTITTGLYGAIYQSPTASWRENVCEQFCIPLDILPKVHPPAEFIGAVHEEAARLTGLAEGTPVLPGMPDLVASLLSVGAVHTYETAAYYGTAGLVPVMKDDLLNAAFHPYPIQGISFVGLGMNLHRWRLRSKNSLAKKVPMLTSTILLLKYHQDLKAWSFYLTYSANAVLNSILTLVESSLVSRKVIPEDIYLDPS
jgi:xylulokinase